MYNTHVTHNKVPFQISTKQSSKAREECVHKIEKKLVDPQERVFPDLLTFFLLFTFEYT